MSHETPLDAVAGLTEAEVRTLMSFNLVTAEAVVAAASTPDGLSSLAEALEQTVSEAGRVVAVARAALPEDVAAEMEIPVDTSEFGLGALPPLDRPGPADD